jgi:hypothetical protein
MKECICEHAYMTHDIENEPILQMGSDKMTRRYVYDKPYTIIFSDRREWNKGFGLYKKSGTNLVYRWYENRKRHWCWGVLPWNKEKLSFSHGKYTTVVHAEVYAIKACAVENID